MTSSSAFSGTPPSWSRKAYVPRYPDGKWPYTSSDFDRYDPSPDTVFYQPTRLVTHIDDHAISKLSEYYAQVLPRSGTILDLCSSWISHYPPNIEKLASSQDVKVVGMGMNKAELGQNPILHRRIIQDLNVDPTIPADVDDIKAATCVVSIDYLTRPVEVLKALHEKMEPGAEVHLAISNRCFPTKAIKRWLDVNEDERLQMVGDFLWFAGFRQIDILTLSDGTIGGAGGVSRLFNRCDPLWVVKGRKEG
jgi:hypothetical protein